MVEKEETHEPSLTSPTPTRHRGNTLISRAGRPDLQMA